MSTCLHASAPRDARALKDAHVRGFLHDIGHAAHSRAMLEGPVRCLAAIG